MKKIIAILLALLFVTALAACGGKTEEAAPAPAAEAPAEQKQDQRPNDKKTAPGRVFRTVVLSHRSHLLSER